MAEEMEVGAHTRELEDVNHDAHTTEEFLNKPKPPTLRQRLIKYGAAAVLAGAGLAAAVTGYKAGLFNSAEFESKGGSDQHHTQNIDNQKLDSIRQKLHQEGK